jgi:GNAT superfamily N-acetyltransferase
MSGVPLPASVAHAAVLAELHALAFPPEERWSAGAFATQLALPGVFGLVLPDAGLILARVAADEAEILTIGVVPAARRAGYGAALLRAAEARAVADGAARFTWRPAIPRSVGAPAIMPTCRMHWCSRGPSSPAQPQAGDTVRVVALIENQMALRRRCGRNIAARFIAAQQHQQNLPTRHAVKREPRADERHRTDQRRNVERAIDERWRCLGWQAVGL